MWPVSERTNEDDEEKADVEVQEYVEHIHPRTHTKKVECVSFAFRRRRRNKLSRTISVYLILCV